MQIDGAEIDDIYRALSALQRQPGCEDLLQFRSLTTAYQYSRLVKLVKANVSSGSEVLDWGCGNGHFSYTLRALGYRTSGFGFDDFGLRRHISPPYSFTRGEADEPVVLPYDSNSFDAVVSVGVLEHVRETGGAEAASLAEIRRVLRPDGVFICYHFPNRFSWIETIRALFPNPPVHRYRYTKRDIAGLFENAGMECVRLERYGALPRNFWHRAPMVLRTSTTFAKFWNDLDDLLAIPLNSICQNYAFVARKAAANQG